MEHIKDQVASEKHLKLSKRQNYMPQAVKSAVKKLNEVIQNRWNFEYQFSMHQLKSWFDTVAAFSSELFNRLRKLYSSRRTESWLAYITYEGEIQTSKGIFIKRQPGNYIHKQAPVLVGQLDIPF
ncbi:hypothetical protein [Pseudoalteromonas luteoviolacea]|uniref:Uncharacterized protein n=1 Tax=Pseudoalteromonas luteoviolacea S4060-1 TaxID=1365257 RepID=A0A162C3G7_9GAMM|nr:hypothetical protein [Pseudoalteromonas luteoviolacea]KZN61544.1 hypothetical protein N478_05575 [Pseudoalteromonas luteoviolacea S4060-1]